MHKIIVALLLLASISAFSIQGYAAPFEKGDAQAGKQLFEQDHCNRCHIAMMGGDGSAIFTRPDHKVRSPQQLLVQLGICGPNAGVTLSDQDKQDLGAYLNQNYYKFK
jgi:cytochrome c553